MDGDLLTAIGAGVVSGLSSTLATVAALKVHISYLRQNAEINNAAIKRAHERITKLSDVVNRCKMTILRLHPGEKL